MNWWKRWKRTLQLIFDPTTRQIAAAIRLGEAKERNRAKREAQNKPYVFINQAGQKAAQSQIGCYEKPERTTGPVQGIRRRAMTREFQAHPGILMRHNAEMQKKAQTVKLDPETVILPVVQQPRKLHFQRMFAEADNPFNAL